LQSLLLQLRLPQLLLQQQQQHWMYPVLLLGAAPVLASL
jgi:hypothetical protein